MRVVPVRGAWVLDGGEFGTPERVDPAILRAMTTDGFVPVVAPIGLDEEARTYNVNADVVAGAIAESLPAEKLILLTDVEGVLDGDGKLRERLSVSQADELLSDGSVQGGMIPKLRCCAQALRRGVSAAHIIDGRVPHALLLEIFTDGGVGTLVGS